MCDFPKGANLIEEEKMEIGGVKWAVYSYYAKSIGFFFSSGTFLLYFIYQVQIYDIFLDLNSTYL